MAEPPRTTSGPSPREEPPHTVRLILDPAGFARIRGDPAFHRVLTLARIVNTIRFNEVAIITSGEDGTPSATRQASSAMFYLAAILWEAFRFADRLGEHFRDSPAFREAMVPLLRDPAVRELRGGLLSRLRNQAVYHHDDAVIPEGLGVLVGEGARVLESSVGDTPQDAYYNLADITVMQFALGGPPDADQFGPRGSAALQAIVTSARAFASAADRIIKEYASRTGWRSWTGDATPPWIDVAPQGTPDPYLYARTEQRGLVIHLGPAAVTPPPRRAE